MQKVSYSRHRFPPSIIQHAIWLYFKFSLSYRDVEDLLAEPGIDVSYETVRRWVLKFGSVYARRLKKTRPNPSMQHRMMAICQSTLQFTTRSTFNAISFPERHYANFVIKR